MTRFFVASVIASIVLTALLNLLPLVFPNAAAKVQRKLEDNARRMIEQHEDDGQPRVSFFFPWKAMMIASIVLTIIVNLIGIFSR